MTDFLSLIKDTGAYRQVLGDKATDRLSHAYLVVCADSENVIEYLKIFAQVILCKEGSPCGKCRDCKLIQDKIHPDVTFYPKNGDTVLSDDVVDLIERSYLKPIENDRKVFALSGTEKMFAVAQNKLLKTLEEPPQGVHILMGATSEFPLLSTIKSRVKKLEIPAFSSDALFSALRSECTDAEKLKEAIACGDGTVGKAKALYGNEDLSKILELATDTLCNMKSSKDLLKFSAKITSAKVNLDDFFTVLELLLRDMLCVVENESGLVSNKEASIILKNSQGFNRGALIFGLESVAEVKKRRKFNGGDTMLLEWLLFSILEGKHKWQKS